MTNITIVYPENLAYVVEMIKDHIDEVLADANNGGNTGNDKCGIDAIDADTINQTLLQTGFQAIT